MSKSGRKISGFFKAMLLAIVSFFVIFLFFSDVSEKLFGTSIKGSPELVQKAGEIGDKIEEGVKEGAKEAGEELLKNMTNNLTSNMDGGK